MTYQTSKRNKNMRLKYNSDDPSAFKCCICCHVRVGTILLGVWHLLCHLLVLAVIVIAAVRPELLKDGMEPGASMEMDGIKVALDPSTNDSFEVKYETPAESYSGSAIMKERSSWFVLFFVCSFLIVAMLLFGAIKHRAMYLMPFFCMQVFDFCITCLSVVGYMSYTPNIKLWLIQNNLANQPGFDQIMTMDDDWLMLVCVIIIVLVLSLKAYLIGMVWSCYRYIQLRTAGRSVVREYTVDLDSEMLLPPKYEEAIRMKSEGPAPPPYVE